MKIGLDFDDVIAHSHLLKPVIAKELYGVHIEPEAYSRRLVVGEGVLTNDQYTEVSRQLFQGNRPMKPVPGALEHISMMQNDGHDLCVVTNRSEAYGSLRAAEEWMIAYGLDIPMVGIEYGKDKTEACRGLDIFVDDDLTKLLPLVGVVDSPMLFSWPQNVWESGREGIITVDSWNRVYMHVYILSK